VRYPSTVNAFEQIAARFYEAQGYWTLIGLKINFTKSEKRAAGNPTMPRPEVDVVAFKPGSNELLIIECKSYLDSQGVRVESFVGDSSIHQDRLKLFSRPTLRELITKKLLVQLQEQGLLSSQNPTVRYGLVAGKIKGDDERQLRAIFSDNDWLLVTPKELAQGLRKFAARGYEDDIITMAVKILERNSID
jgi:hypothetical protein